ncbi:MAG: DUF177 domain-containing protein [Proteobacteria bacterium]|nr:DUF177 domain-containing protein [Pseudomonadota bacterium]
MSAILWTHYTRDIPGSGLDIRRDAAPDELLELAREIDVPAVRSLHVRYRIVPSAGDRFTLSGDLRAELTRECVVTLEPVEETVSADLSAIFSESQPGADDPTPGPIADIEAPESAPIVNGTIDVGRIVFEELVAGLDPYPKKQGAEFAWEDKAAAASPANPFAALAQLKKAAKSPKDE